MIQNTRLFLIVFFHFLKAAHGVLDPIEYEHADIDCIAWRCIKHRTIVRMGLIVKHGGSDVHCMADQVLADNDNRQTGRSHVLLSACIQYAELAHIDRFTQNAGGNIRYQRDLSRLRQLCKFGTVDGVVHADVEIVRIFGKGRRIELRYIAEGLILRRSHNIRFTVAGRFFICLCSPLASNHKVGLAAFGHQIHGNHCKLGGCTTL